MTLKIPSEPKWSCVPASGKQINTCAITPDGSRVVGGSDDGRLFCWAAD